MRPLAISLLTCLLSACASSGIGHGYLHNGVDAPVSLEWQSKGSVSGMLTARLEDGRVFTGSYFQITRESRIDRLGPLWVGWQPGWRGWPYWYREPGPDFVRHYSGRVLANLSTDNGEHMRCRIHLAQPAAGLRGGGQGNCQLADGSTVEVEFPLP